MFNEGSRSLQAAFGTEELADRLATHEARQKLTDSDVGFIARQSMFFLATADPSSGEPLCSYKGGEPGFVRILGPTELAFPDFDGNGTFRSLGNLTLNPRVALLFIDFAEQARTLVEGRASIHRDSPQDRWYGAQLEIRVQVVRAFSSCSRYIHKMALEGVSEYVPQPGVVTPVPSWKLKPQYRDAIDG